MTPEDRTLDGAAVDEVARGGAAETSPSGEAAPAESSGAVEATAPDENAYHKALDAYMNGDLTGVVKLVDGVLEQKPPAGLKSRLERLRRRATDRLSREKVDGPAEPAAVVEPAAAEATAAPEPAIAEPAVAEPAPSEPAVAEAPSEPVVAEAPSEPVVAEAPSEPAVDEPAAAEPEPEAPAPVVEAPPVESKPEVVAAPAPIEVATPSPVAPPAVAVAVKTETPVPPERAAKRPQAAPAPRPGGSGVATRPPSAVQAPAGRPISKPAPAPVAGVRPRLSASSGSQPALTPSPGPGGSLKAELDRVAGELDRLRKVVSGVEEHIVKVAEAYGKLAKDGKRKDQAYDQLYEELRQYKDNFLKSAQKPLFLDVVLLFDGITRTIAQFSDMPDEKVTRQLVVDALSHTRDEILELLYRRDIEKIQDATKKLDVAIQKPVTRIETENADEDRDIVSIVREGFRWSGVVLRPQEVVVKRSTKEREPQ